MLCPSGRNNGNSRKCCHLPGEMLNLTAKAGDRARIYFETVRTHTTQKNIYGCGLNVLLDPAVNFVFLSCQV
jgi:hypothetical protein